MRNIVAVFLCQVQAQLICNDPLAFLKPYTKGSKCGAPTRECFDEAAGKVIFSTLSRDPWSKLVNGTFHECNKDDCVGFKLNDKLETMFLCSMHVSYYSPLIEPNTNYIGLTIAAVKKDGNWYYNNGKADNPNKKFM